MLEYMGFEITENEDGLFIAQRKEDGYIVPMTFNSPEEAKETILEVEEASKELSDKIADSLAEAEDNRNNPIKE